MALVRTCRPATRRGATATQLVLVLPLMAVMVVFAVEFARFYFSYVVTAPGTGPLAVSESDPFYMKASPNQSLREAAPADVPNADKPREKLAVESTTEADPTGASTWWSRSATGSRSTRPSDRLPTPDSGDER